MVSHLAGCGIHTAAGVVREAIRPRSTCTHDRLYAAAECRRLCEQAQAALPLADLA